MKIKSITLLGLSILTLSLSVISPVEAKVTGRSSSSVTRSAPAPSQHKVTKTTTTLIKPSNTSRINNTVNTANTQSSLQINSGAKTVIQPTNASYKPQKVNSYVPSNTTLITQTYKAPNPQNKPTETKYVTRSDNTGKSYYSSYYNNYFPSSVSVGYRPIVVDNTPTNGWDFSIFFVVFGSFILIIIVFAFIGSRG
jgi:hypothetical protein